MYKAMRVLAIAALIVTIIGAGGVLYVMNTLSPVVEMAAVTATPAVQAQEIFDSVMQQVRDETFTGRVFENAVGLSPDNCTFLTYTVRLKNRGVFPAEWVSLDMHPVSNASGTTFDALQLDNSGGNVLLSGSVGDVNATLLHVGDASEMQRDYTVTCYVLGQKITLEGMAQ